MTKPHYIIQTYKNGIRIAVTYKLRINLMNLQKVVTPVKTGAQSPRK